MFPVTPVDGLLDVLSTLLHQVANGVTNVFELRLRSKWGRSSPRRGFAPSITQWSGLEPRLDNNRVIIQSHSLGTPSC